MLRTIERPTNATRRPYSCAEVREAAVERKLVHLEVAGVHEHSGGCADGHSEGVRDGVVDRDELAVEGADALPVAFLDLQGVRPDAVLLKLGLDEGEGQLGADERDVGLLAKEEGHAADVVFVAVREHDAVDVVEAVPDRTEVRKDQVDSGLLLLGEEHTTVDDQQAAAEFDDRHVAADLAETTERCDPQAAFGELRRRAELGMRMTQKTLLTRRAPRSPWPPAWGPSGPRLGEPPGTRGARDIRECFVMRIRSF
jgi:hypothetical protein